MAKLWFILKKEKEKEKEKKKKKKKAKTLSQISNAYSNPPPLGIYSCKCQCDSHRLKKSGAVGWQCFSGSLEIFKKEREREILSAWAIRFTLHLYYKSLGSQYINSQKAWLAVLWRKVIQGFNSGPMLPLYTSYKSSTMSSFALG